MAVTQTTETKARGFGFPLGLARRLGLVLTLGLLALGLTILPQGARGAAAAGAAQAGYYEPGIVVAASVPSGVPIGVEGYNFLAYDLVTVYVLDSSYNVVFAGDIVTDGWGYFGGQIRSEYFAPDYYTIVAVDSLGTFVSVGMWVTYD